MQKQHEVTSADSCMGRALDDEMTFVLLARDAAAPVAIRGWIAERIRLGKSRPGDPEVVEAEAIACTMEQTRHVVRETLANGPRAVISEPRITPDGCFNAVIALGVIAYAAAMFLRATFEVLFGPSPIQ